MRFTLAAALLLALVASASAVFDWSEMSNMSSKQTGDATFYGQDPDQVRLDWLVEAARAAATLAATSASCLAEPREKEEKS